MALVLNLLRKINVIRSRISPITDPVLAFQKIFLRPLLIAEKRK